MNITRYAALLTACVMMLSVKAITYDEASAKATRFFERQEWASANALYNHMIHERPEVAQTYGQAIVVTSILNDTIRASQLLEQALGYGIPIDSVLTDVRQYAFMAHHPDVYRQFLLRTIKDTPWMKRAIEQRLLNYCKYRNDADGMIHYSKLLLDGAGDKPEFMFTLAEGYLMNGENDKAVSTWTRLLNMHPGNYEATLYLANYYESVGEQTKARHYYQAAQDIHRTPYVESKLKELDPKRPH